MIQYNLAKVLFNTLNPEKVIYTFLYTFLEKDVIFFSKNIEYLTLTLNAYIPGYQKGTFLFYRKSLTKNKINLNIMKDINKCNLCLIARNKNHKSEGKEILINNEQNKKKSSLKEVVQRLYYKYNLKKLGFKEVKRTKKLTEFIAFNLALKKSRTKNFEDILNPVRKNNSYNP